MMERRQVIPGKDGYEKTMESLTSMGDVFEKLYEASKDGSIIGTPESLLALHYDQNDSCLYANDMFDGSIVKLFRNTVQAIRRHGEYMDWKDGHRISTMAWLFDDFIGRYESGEFNDKIVSIADHVINWMRIYEQNRISSAIYMQRHNDGVWSDMYSIICHSNWIRDRGMDEKTYEIIFGDSDDSMPVGEIPTYRSAILIRLVERGYSMGEALELTGGRGDSSEKDDVIHDGNGGDDESGTTPTPSRKHRSRTETAVELSDRRDDVLSFLLRSSDGMDTDDFMHLRNIIMDNDDCCFMPYDVNLPDSGSSNMLLYSDAFKCILHGYYVYNETDATLFDGDVKIPGIRIADDGERISSFYSYRKNMTMITDNRPALPCSLESMIPLLSMRRHHDCDGISDSDIRFLEDCITDVALATYEIRRTKDGLNAYSTRAENIMHGLMMTVSIRAADPYYHVDDVASVMRLAFEVCSVTMPIMVMGPSNGSKGIMNWFSTELVSLDSSTMNNIMLYMIRDESEKTHDGKELFYTVDRFAAMLLWMADHHVLRKLSKGLGRRMKRYVDPHGKLDTITKDMFNDGWYVSPSVIKRRRSEFSPTWGIGGDTDDK